MAVGNPLLLRRTELMECDNCIDETKVIEYGFDQLMERSAGFCPRGCKRSTDGVQQKPAVSLNDLRLHHSQEPSLD